MNTDLLNSLRYDEIIDILNKAPSDALSYTVERKHYYPLYSNEVDSTRATVVWIESVTGTLKERDPTLFTSSTLYDNKPFTLTLEELSKRLDHLNGNTYKEPLTVESIQSIISYIEEGSADLEVVKAELGEMILRSTGEYFK